MRTRVTAILLALMLSLSLLPVAALAAVTTPDDVTFTVKANTEACLEGDVNITFTKSGSDYSGTLYLPGSVDTSKIKLSWDDEITVASCVSGETAVPANGASTTYTVTVGGSTANFTVTTVQGSKDVAGMFLTIDENLGTIADMNKDPNHEAECFGSLAFQSESYDMSIKGRGNWTWSHDNKKPYNITLYKKENAEKEIKKYTDKKKAEFIEGVEAKKWTILANALDPSYLRNKIGYDVAREMGIGLPSEFVDIWMNGEYLGNYLLTPKNDYDSPKDGFMLEIDSRDDPYQFTVDNSPRFTVKDKSDDISDVDMKNYMSRAWSALRDSKSDDYLNYFDLDSWAKMYVLEEFYKDLDACAGSTFFTKASMDDSDKLIAGPAWDLDNAIGRVDVSYVNMDRNLEDSGGGWYVDNVYDSDQYFFQLLGKHASFMIRVYEIYNEYKEILSGILQNIDVQSKKIKASAEMDFAHWGRATTPSNSNVMESKKTFGKDAYAVTYQRTDSWERYTDNLKEYVNKRLAFLSDNLSVSAPKKGNITGNTSLAQYDALRLTADCTAGSYQWQSSADGRTWTNIDGATGKTYFGTALYTMNETFIRCVAKNVGKTINTSRVAKAAAGAVTVLEPVKLTVTQNGHEVHNYQSAVTEPTCTERGYTTYTCACGESYVDNYTEAKGHNYRYGKCTRCGEKDPDAVPGSGAAGSLLRSVAEIITTVTQSALQVIRTILSTLFGGLFRL